jgi:hypothetical protein
MKKITQIFILFISIIILSSLTFINIFKESFQIELSEEEKNIINNLKEYDTKIDNLKKNNLLPQFDQNIELLKNNQNKSATIINNSTSSLTNVNSTNLTVKKQLDMVQNILGTGIFLPIQKLGIVQNVKDTPYLLNANLLKINDGTTPTSSFEPTPTPTFSYEPTPTPTFSYEPTPTPTFSYEPTPTPTFSYEPTPTPTSSFEPTPTPTFSYEPTPTPTFSYEPTPTPTFSYESSNQSTSTSSFESSNQSTSTSSFEPSNQSTSTSSFEPSNQSISTFMNVAKRSKESFNNLLNNIQARKSVENFSEPVNWREEWNAKLESISRTKSLPLSNTEPKINDNETSFYIVQNSNLEKNLENTSSNIIKMQMENMTEKLRDKWIEINRNNKK